MAPCNCGGSGAKPAVQRPATGVNGPWSANLYKGMHAQHSTAPVTRPAKR